MVEDKKREPTKNRTTAERASDRETVVTRRFDAPARLVFEAWTTPALLKRWWGSHAMGMSLVACEADVRPGGTYRFVIDVGGARQMTFFGSYVEVIPNVRLVWTNEESGADGPVTTVTFAEKDGKTTVVMRELYPSKAALDEAGMGACEGMGELFDQLDGILPTLG